MPRFTDIHKVLVIGSGGIVIAQAAEFDYSGSQCLKALREEGIETVLINPNVATIQTSMKMADKVYLEPCTVDTVEKIIKREQPDGVLLGFGGQTALNVGVQLARRGVFKREGIRVLGTSIHAIDVTEDRLLFKQAMVDADVPIAESNVAYSVEEGLEIAVKVGYPVIIRTAYMLGGGGSGIAHNEEEMREIVEQALEWSIERQVLIEQYLGYWKEIELEVMRDYEDNTIIIAALENLDPMGIHTGDSIVVAPTQTLSNREYQLLRSASIRVIRSVGIVGECNIQFALDPHSERFVAIEVNPRMSRSSALASKATGYPLAYIAAKLALGYHLPELVNKVTGMTTACFEPALDYIVVKIPRWDFQKFPGQINRILGPMMKSVGEVMSIARSFEEALQKAIRELDIGKIGLVGNAALSENTSLESLQDALAHPTDQRIFQVAEAMEMGLSNEEINRLSGIDNWFLAKIRNIVDMSTQLTKLAGSTESESFAQHLRHAKELGFSDAQIAHYLHTEELTVRNLRQQYGILPSFKIVDTMAAEWPSQTNYCYVTYGDSEDDVDVSSNRSKVIVLGAGCIRIGSSVEFDYCTMNTAWSMKEEGIEEVIVVNNNPETVSTDYDMSDKLYFEEITFERILDIIEHENPIGVVVSVGGQTPNNLALPLARQGIRLLGTAAGSIDRAENRSKFSALLDRLGIAQPIWRQLSSLEDITAFSDEIGYPVLVRPSYVLSGAAMRVAYNKQELLDYVHLATTISPEYPIVISKLMANAKEIEVDAISDGRDTLIGAIIEHVEFAGTHSGDATMVIPPQTLSAPVIAEIEDSTRRIARALNIKGPFNIQFLVKNDNVYIIECNLRASRSIPYTSKATGIPMIWLAAKVMLDKSLRELNCLKKPPMLHYAVKVPTFSFIRLKGADPTLGVEMTSTGEVACLDYDFANAYLKALRASNLALPSPEKPILITVKDEDQATAVEIARKLHEMNFQIVATRGTAKTIQAAGIPDVTVVRKLSEEGDEQSIQDFLANRKVGFVINSPSFGDGKSFTDGYAIRRMAVEYLIPVITNIETAQALVTALHESGHDTASRVILLNDLLKHAPLARHI